MSAGNQSVNVDMASVFAQMSNKEAHPEKKADKPESKAPKSTGRPKTSKAEGPKSSASQQFTEAERKSAMESMKASLTASVVSSQKSSLSVSVAQANSIQALNESLANSRAVSREADMRKSMSVSASESASKFASASAAAQVAQKPVQEPASDEQEDTIPGAGWLNGSPSPGPSPSQVSKDTQPVKITHKDGSPIEKPRFKRRHAFQYKEPLSVNSFLMPILGYDRVRGGYYKYHFKYKSRGQGHDFETVRVRLPLALIQGLRSRLIRRNPNVLRPGFSKSNLKDSQIVAIAIMQSGLLHPRESDALADAYSTHHNRTISQIQIGYDQQIKGSSSNEKLDKLLRGQAEIKSNSNYTYNLLNRFKDGLLKVMYGIFDLVADLWSIRVAGFSDFSRVKKDDLRNTTKAHLEHRDEHNRNRINEIVDASLDAGKASAKRKRHEYQRKHQRYHGMF